MSGRALIGHTGFVGSHLMEQGDFDAFFNSANFRDMAGHRFDEIVCAGVSAVKWWANRNPEADWQAIADLCDVLTQVRAGHFVLISTVDVYPDPQGVDETSELSLSEQPYGRHRRLLELFVAERFPATMIARLPGLFGKRLKKNLVFDALSGRVLSGFHPDSTFQFYDLERLTGDIAVARAAGLPMINLAVEPVSVARTLAALGSAEAGSEEAPGPARYDMRTAHAKLWGRDGGYIESAGDCLARMARFAAIWRAAA
jgi:hypothetical protein